MGMSGYYNYECKYPKTNEDNLVFVETMQVIKKLLDENHKEFDIQYICDAEGVSIRAKCTCFMIPPDPEDADVDIDGWKTSCDITKETFEPIIQAVMCILAHNIKTFSVHNYFIYDDCDYWAKGLALAQKYIPDVRIPVESSD